LKGGGSSGGQRQRGWQRGRRWQAHRVSARAAANNLNPIRPAPPPRPQVPEELWGGRLALALLAQRASGGASPFAPYVSALPRGFPGVPMFFSREAIEAIDYPPVVEQVGDEAAGLGRC
jgi:hypothetical protein